MTAVVPAQNALSAGPGSLAGGGAPAAATISAAAHAVRRVRKSRKVPLPLSPLLLFVPYMQNMIRYNTFSGVLSILSQTYWSVGSDGEVPVGSVWGAGR